MSTIVAEGLTKATNPEVLIMDDPTLGLDPAVRRQFLKGIVHLIMREGRTVLFSSHILSDVERVADRLLVMVDGRLRFSHYLLQDKLFDEDFRKVAAPETPFLHHLGLLLNCGEFAMLLWSEAEAMARLGLGLSISVRVPVWREGR